jgi:hypothetical protein
VFTEPLLRKGLHYPVVPPLLGTYDIENTVSSIVACWTVFTELLPGNTLIKSVNNINVRVHLLIHRIYDRLEDGHFMTETCRDLIVFDQ